MITQAKCDLCGKEGDAVQIERQYDDIDRCEKCRLENHLILLKSQEDTQASLVSNTKKILNKTRQEIRNCKHRLQEINKS